MIGWQHELWAMSKIALEISTEIPADFDFNEEFQRAFSLMEETNKHIYVTGKAGTGKSTLLEYFRTNTKKKIAVLSPTGVAAIKARGQTIHSFFKLPPRFIQKDHIRRLRNKEVFNHLDTLVIDEASMMRADLLDGIDHALRINREMHNTPFGGVQIVVFGDLFQLPPVVERETRNLMDSLYQSPYFFSAHSLKSIDLEYLELKKIYRQKDDDFINLLNKIRVNKVNEDDLGILNEHVDSNVSHGVNGIITLTTTNNDAAGINETCLARIKPKGYIYRANIRDKFDKSAYPTRACLVLKKGAQVMLIKNDKEKRWVNGTIAEIEELSETCIKVSIGGHIYDVPKTTWEKIEYVYNDTKDKIEEKVIGSFEQYPLKLAWAITIHKSQGQTFRDVIIDMGHGAFTHGQTYVALSRCTSLEGIVLKRPIISSDIIFDNRIYQFHKLHREKKDVKGSPI